VITDFYKLVDQTALMFDVHPDEILGPSRKKEPSRARHVVMALWADHHSYQDAANRCGRKCHSTVIHAREKILNKAGIDQSLANMLEMIVARCQYGASEETTSEPRNEEKFLEIRA
jgi:hypothetical protein